MAQAAIVAVAQFFIAVGVKAAVAKFAATIFVYAASAYLLRRASKSLTPKSRAPGSLAGADISYFDTGAPMRIVYGLVRTGGMETIPPMVSGANNKFLHKVLTLAGHEVDSFTHTHFDTTTITNAQIGPVAFTSSDGMVTAGTYSGHAFVRCYRGTSTDSADRILCDVLSSAFGQFRGKGVAKAELTFTFNDDIYKSTPVPTFTYQGKRCYDPRLDSSPGADPTNASFAAWTQNPALALADFLMADYGGSYAKEDIDWSTVVTAANYCEGSLLTPSGSQARYTINGVLLATDDFQDNVKTIVDAMLGRIIFANGKWRMYAGSWKTPDFTVEKKDWISGLSIKFEQGKRKRFNRMRVWFIDKEREWQRVECFPRSSSTYLAADKGIIADAETEQLLCTEKYEAQRKGEFLLRQSRNQIIVSGRLPPKFQAVATWDTGTLIFDDLGWSSKTFRAASVDINEDGSVDCVFAEEQSADWDDSLSYDAQSTTPLPLTNSTSPSEPRNFTAVPQVNGTILFMWDKPIVYPIGSVVEIIRSTNSADASVGTKIWEGAASPVPLVSPTSAHWYWSRTRWKQRWSDYSPNTFGVGAIARLEADQTLQNRLCGDAEFEYGATASLWEMGSYRNRGLFRFAQTNVFGGSDLNGLVMTRETDADSAFQFTYNATGGQFGGFVNVRRHPTATDSAGVFEGLILASNPLVPGSGHSYNGEPFGVEFVARVRINTPNFTAVQLFEFGVMTIWDAPGSLGLQTWTARFAVGSSAAYRQGEWSTMRGFGIVLPPAVQLSATSFGAVSVRSAQGFYMRPGLLFNITGSQGNFDIDYFQATNIGFRNEPIQAFLAQEGSAPRALEMYEFMAMHNNVLNVFSGTAVSFPSSDVFRWQDWRQYPIGRRFSFQKTSTALSAYLVPSSGMTLKLNGRAAVGTVTFVTSLPGYAVVEKTGAAEFTVEGTPLAVI